MHNSTYKNAQISFCLSFSMVVLVSCQSKSEEDEEIEGDVGLELKVNFAERAVIRNARLSGQWGASETALSFFPFASGEPFKVECVCAFGDGDLILKIISAEMSVS